MDRLDRKSLKEKNRKKKTRKSKLKDSEKRVHRPKPTLDQLELDDRSVKVQVEEYYNNNNKKRY